MPSKSTLTPTNRTSSSTKKSRRRPNKTKSLEKQQKQRPVFDLTGLLETEQASTTAPTSTSNLDLDSFNSSWGSISVWSENEDDNASVSSQASICRGDISKDSTCSRRKTKRASSKSMTDKSLKDKSGRTISSKSSCGSSSLLGDYDLEENDGEDDVGVFDTIIDDNFIKTELARRHQGPLLDKNSSEKVELQDTDKLMADDSSWGELDFCYFPSVSKDQQRRPKSKISSMTEVSGLAGAPSRRRVASKDFGDSTTEVEVCLKSLYTDYRIEEDNQELGAVDRARAA